MTALLDRAFDRVRALDHEEEADLIEAEAEIARGDLASDAEVDAVFKLNR